MSANQQFKQYMGKLEAAALAGGPLGQHSSAKLEMLEDMDRSERFQWFCANVLGEDAIAPRKARKDKRADTAHAMAEAIGNDMGIDRDAGLALLELLAEQLGCTVLGVSVVDDKPKASKPKAERKPRVTRRAKNAGVSEGSRWKKSTLTYLGYPTKVGKSFRHTSKAGTFRWTITENQDEFVLAVKS